MTMAICAILIAMMDAQSRTQVVLLGTGTPRQDPDRSGPATAIVDDGKVFLVDCGPGVVRRASAAKAAGVNALSMPNLKVVFITHLHSDHTLGYPDLIFSPWVVGRKDPLESYGPKGLADMTKHLLAAYKVDIDIRTHGLEHGNNTGWKVNVHEIEPGLVFDHAGVKVTAIPVKHGSFKSAFGYRFDTPTRSIVISGDTSPCKELEAASNNVDVLIHEVYSSDEASPENRSGGQDWVRYMHAYHTSAKELGELASRSKPKLLVLYHVLRRKETDEQLIQEIRGGGYQGPVVVGKDLQSF